MKKNTSRSVHPRINSLKGNFTLILSLLVLFIIVVGVGTQKDIQKKQVSSQLTPTEISNAEWKTYKDKNNTFTMQYPSSFYETLETASGDFNLDISAGALSTVTPYNSGFKKESDILIEMAIRTLRPNTTLNDYIDTNILTYTEADIDGDGITGPPIKITPTVRTSINLDGKEAIWVEDIAFMSVSHTEVFIPYTDDNIVVIRVYEGTGPQEDRNLEQYRKNIQLGKQIISTIKFTN